MLQLLDQQERVGHDGTIKAVRAGIALWQLPLNIKQLMTAGNAQQLGVAD